MAEEQVKNTMRKFRQALEGKDTEKILSFFTDDATWEAPEGKFGGKAELKRYVTWLSQMPDLKITESGIKIMAQGDTAVYEHIISGTFEGRKWEVLAMCVYEFAGDKIKTIRSVNDRLAIAKQTAKGMMAKRAVNAIVNAMEKGLH